MPRRHLAAATAAAAATVAAAVTLVVAGDPADRVVDRVRAAAADHTGAWTEPDLRAAAGPHQQLLVRVDGPAPDGGVLVFTLGDQDPRACLWVRVSGRRVVDHDTYRVPGAGPC